MRLPSACLLGMLLAACGADGPPVTPPLPPEDEASADEVPLEGPPGPEVTISGGGSFGVSGRL